MIATSNSALRRQTGIGSSSQVSGSCAPTSTRRERAIEFRPDTGVARPVVFPVTITLREINEDNAQSVLALRCTPAQERFVTSVTDSLAEADEYPQANPWFRAVYAEGRPVGFVILSWNVEPQPPEIIGPWFLWKLLIDHRHQGKGYGREVVQQILELVRGQGGSELLTSHVPGEGGPAGFYARLGFAPTEELDPDGEIMLRRMVRE